MKIGHCYFFKDEIIDEDIKFTVKYNLMPLVEDYFYDDEKRKNEIIGKLESSIK